jgi:hypothetical protein
MDKQTMQVLTLMNKMRAVQGWGVLSDNDVTDVVNSCKYQLDRYGIHPDLYDKLFDMALDYRITAMNNRERHIPTLNIEFIIHMYQRYKEDKYNKLQSLKLALSQVNYEIHSVKIKDKSLESALQSINTIAKSFGFDPVESLKECNDLSKKLKLKIETFLEDNLLA